MSVDLIQAVGPTTVTATNLSFIVCDTRAGAVVINLPAGVPGATSLTQFVYVKDAFNTAGTNSITVNADGADLIEKYDGSTDSSLLINSDAAEVTLAWTGARWSIL